MLLQEVEYKAHTPALRLEEVLKKCEGCGILKGWDYTGTEIVHTCSVTAAHWNLNENRPDSFMSAYHTFGLLYPSFPAHLIHGHGDKFPYFVADIICASLPIFFHLHHEQDFSPSHLSI